MNAATRKSEIPCRTREMSRLLTRPTRSMTSDCRGLSKKSPCNVFIYMDGMTHRRQRPKDPNCIHKPSQPRRLVQVKARHSKQGLGPGGNGQDASPLLEPLQSESHPHATPQMQASRVAANGKVPETIALPCRGFHNGLQLLDLRLQNGTVVRQVSADFGEDFDGFGSSVVGDQPPGRVREEHDGESDDQYGTGTC